MQMENFKICETLKEFDFISCDKVNTDHIKNEDGYQDMKFSQPNGVLERSSSSKLNHDDFQIGLDDVKASNEQLTAISELSDVFTKSSRTIEEMKIEIEDEPLFDDDAIIHMPKKKSVGESHKKDFSFNPCVQVNTDCIKSEDCCQGNIFHECRNLDLNYKISEAGTSDSRHQHYDSATSSNVTAAKNREDLFKDYNDAIVPNLEATSISLATFKETHSYATEYETALAKLKNKKLTETEYLKFISCPEGDESEDEIDECTIEAESDEHFTELLSQFHWHIEEEHTDANDDDSIPLPTLFSSTSKVNVPRHNASSSRNPSDFRWEKVDFDPPKDTKWKDSLTIDDDWYEQPPMFFFNKMFDQALIQYITQQTCMYALQTNGKKLKLQAEEMKVFLGILLLAGILNVPSYRTFWKKSFQLTVVTDAMSRDRFEEIKRYLHFNDNTIMKSKEHPDFDKLFKIRPVIDSIRSNFKKIPQEEHQVVDEQIIPTKARISIKQYTPKKPHKWGYKVITRAGASGFVYDMVLYTGKDSKRQDYSGVGIASSHVLDLSVGVPRNKNYKLFYDNWFSSVGLAIQLKELGILNLATIRENRLKGCKLKDEKELKKDGRGSVDHRVEINSNLVVVQWLDSKSVHFLSTYAGIDPTDTARCWDGKARTHINIERPFAVQEYNKFVGGVDLCDMLLELYRIDFKSRKWYMRIFFYFLDLCVVNGWLLHRRMCTFTNSKQVHLSDFKEDIALTLLNSLTSRKRGLPSIEAEVVKKKRRTSHHPVDSIRLDGGSHMPMRVKDQKRCKKCVTGYSRFSCVKCKVHLCITLEKNCFMLYHEA